VTNRVFLDTNIFIYLIEDRSELGASARKLLDRFDLNGDRLLSSSLTLGEVLTQPLSQGHLSLAAEYERLLNAPAVEILDFTRSAGRFYALIRQDRTIKIADAMQLAIAAAAGCDLFITNDERLSRKSVKGIGKVLSLQHALIQTIEASGPAEHS
jgi:predicted nucleic acid-binding protein